MPGPLLLPLHGTCEVCAEQLDIRPPPQIRRPPHSAGACTLGCDPPPSGGSGTPRHSTAPGSGAGQQGAATCSSVLQHKVQALANGCWPLAVAFLARAQTSAPFRERTLKPNTWDANQATRLQAAAAALQLASGLSRLATHSAAFACSSGRGGSASSCAAAAGPTATGWCTAPAASVACRPTVAASSCLCFRSCRAARRPSCAVIIALPPAPSATPGGCCLSPAPTCARPCPGAAAKQLV